MYVVVHIDVVSGSVVAAGAATAETFAKVKDARCNEKGLYRSDDLLLTNQVSMTKKELRHLRVLLEELRDVFMSSTSCTFHTSRTRIPISCMQRAPYRAMWSSHGDKKAQRMKPSEILNAFSVAKANAARRATPSKIIDFVNAEDHTARVSSTIPVHKPLFEPTPSEVWIDDYTPFHTVTIKLSFRNCDTVTRRMKIESPQSPFFKVSPWSPSSITGANSRSVSDNRIDGKIAAGMDIAFQLDFSPQEVKEYTLDLVRCTERSRFVVPVRVQGRYAALDIPDEIHFGLCPVKMATDKVLTVRNVGSRGAKFALKTSDNFQIAPPSAALEQGAAI
ncbi:hypothetical protein FI667_g5471, partial [Globisporangium splendens]